MKQYRHLDQLTLIMNMLYFAFCLLSVLPCVFMAPTRSFANMKQLDPNYDLYWEANSTYIMFEIRVRTTGWVGFGLSSDGLMFPGDVVLGWVSHHKTTFDDYHTTAHAPPTKDASQDWTLYSSSESANGETVMTFGRLLDTNDADDMVIHPGAINVIYAWGDADSLTYHATNRGSAKIELLAGVPAAVGK